MNIVLESLFLRRPRIEYVSPPVCPVQPTSASASSSSVIDLPDVCVPVAPMLSIGQNNILTWRPLPDSCEDGCQNSPTGPQTDCKSVEICYSIYQAVDPTNLNGAYNLIFACVPRLTTIMCTPGCYEAAAVDAHGIEIARSAPVCGDGSGPIFIPMPVAPGAVEYNLYRTSDFRNPGGVYQLVLSMYGGEGFESCLGGAGGGSGTNCFRVGFVTPDGATPLSNPVCITLLCPPKVCPVGQIWNAASCSCVPLICPEEPCTPGLVWDFDACQCVPCPPQPCLPSQIWDPTMCQCETCPPQPCPRNYGWDPTTCTCKLLPGPNWGVGWSPDLPWAIYQGDFGGTFPPVFGIGGGFFPGGFNGTLFLTGQSFNNALARGQGSVSYTGISAHVLLTLTIGINGSGIGHPNNAFYLQLNGAKIFSSIGQGGTTQVDSTHSNMYTFDFHMPAGANSLSLFVQEYAPGTHTDVLMDFEFQNIA